MSQQRTSEETLSTIPPSSFSGTYNTQTDQQLACPLGSCPTFNESIDANNESVKSNDSRQMSRDFSLIPVRITPRLPRVRDHEPSPPSNHNNLIIIPSTKPTTNMDPFQRPSENSQYVPSLLLSNTMSLAQKIDEIAFTIHQKDIQLALFTETWLKDLIPDDPINISGYHLFRLDHKNKQHGGVCSYVKNIIESKTLSVLHNDEYEVLWCML